MYFPGSSQRRRAAAMECNDPGSSSQLAARSQRREQPAAQTAATSGNQRSGASSQRRNLKRKIEPGLYGRSANPKWKTRVPGLFRIRHWVDPQHKEAFIRELEAIKLKQIFKE